MSDTLDKGILENIEIPIYKIVINVAIAETCSEAVMLGEEIGRVFAKYGDWDNTYGAYLYSKEDNLHSIVLAEDASVGTIAHECFHAIMTVLQLKGIRYSQKSEEAFAYVLGYLTEKVYELKKDYERKYNK